MKPSPQRATLERQGKRKAEADGNRNKTSGGGGRQKRLNQPDTAKTYINLSTQRAKPTWREENARTHELDDGWPESVDEQSLLLLVWRH